MFPYQSVCRIRGIDPLQGGAGLGRRGGGALSGCDRGGVRSGARVAGRSSVRQFVLDDELSHGGVRRAVSRAFWFSSGGWRVRG